MESTFCLPCLYAYVIVMIYIILGCGIRLPELARWLRFHGDVPLRKRVYEIIVGILLWPWIDPARLWDKYSACIRHRVEIQ